MSDGKIKSRSPNYYVRKRLANNKPAMVGLIFILFTSLIALMGYTIMPDSTPDANDGAVQIQKRPPGAKVDFIKLRKKYPVEKVSFFKRIIYGQESQFNLLPITHYEFKNGKVLYQEYGRNGGVKELELIPVVLSDDYQNEGINNFKIGRNEVTYIDKSNREQIITIKEIQARFKTNHIETRKYFLGTDRSGRDMLSRLMFGIRISLSIGLVSVAISILLGMSLGAMAGFFGGKIDNFILWFMSVIWSIPGIMLVIAISIALQSRGVWVAFVAVGLTMWVDVARVVRGQIMGIKQKTYVEAARALGINDFRIVYVHILPNIIGPLIVIATANFAAAILLEAGLSFLGLSVQPPTPSWGSMILEGFSVIGTKNSWHLIVFPGLAISFTVLSFNLLGNGLRDAFDPKTIIK